MNKTLDNVKPVLNSVDLYSTPDRTSVYFTHLTDKAFNDWNNSGNNNGDFGKNHITDSVYIEIEATDNSSGIAGILVKEKLYKYSDGSSTSANEPVVPYYIEVEKSQEANKYFCNYTMGNTYDGIIELEIFAQDYADNLSQTSKKYYILKDTLIDTSLLRFNEETIALEPGQWLNAILEQEIDGDNQNVKITLPENTKDIFYDNLTSDFDLHVYWGYSKDSITNSVTRNGNEFSFTRDVKRLVYIKIECKDSVGNKKETIKSMDPRAIIERFIYTLPDPNNNIYFSTNIEVKDVASMLLQNEKDVESISGVKLIFDIEGDENKKMAVYDTNLMLNGDIISDWAYRFRDATQSQIPYGSSVKMYAVSLCGDFLSPISQDYVQFTITNWPENEAPQDIVYADNCSPRLSSQTNNSTGNGTGEILYELGPYIKDTFKVKAEPIKNSGSYKITLDDYMTQAGKNNSDVRYEFTLYNKYGKLGTIDTHQFMIWAPEECIIFVTAISPDGKIYKPYQDFNEQQLIMESFEQYTIDDPYYGNLNLGELGQFNFYLNESADTENILKLTKDVRAPHFKLNDSNFYETCSAAGYNIYLPIGDIIETTNPGQPEQDLYKNENGKYEFSYYLLPNSSNKLQRGMTYSLEELDTYYSKYERKYEFSMLRTEATIPFGNKEGLFNLVAVAKDTSGNYSIITTPVVSRTLGPITYTRDLYDGTVSATLNSNEHLQIYSFNAGWNGWSQTDENLTFYDPEGNPVNTHDNWYKITGYRDFADGSDSARDIGFFYTEYFYGLPAVCNSKNILNGYNGYQVFCDRPVFVHTMFSPDKLTDSTESENALQIWESKGAETGRVVNNSNFTYAKDKYNEIPSGWYYTTIFHFADGDVIMTDIQQK